jgi:RHH-type rel operon transcriptional repressor/antitoxin RelB
MTPLGYIETGKTGKRLIPYYGNTPAKCRRGLYWNRSVVRLERLAKSTGRSRSFLAAEAINGYLEVNEWQVTGIKRAIASLDRGEGFPHDLVKDWVASWGNANEKPVPRHS